MSEFLAAEMFFASLDLKHCITLICRSTGFKMFYNKYYTTLSVNFSVIKTLLRVLNFTVSPLLVSALHAES